MFEHRVLNLKKFSDFACGEVFQLFWYDYLFLVFEKTKSSTFLLDPPKLDCLIPSLPDSFGCGESHNRFSRKNFEEAIQFCPIFMAFSPIF